MSARAGAVSPAGSPAPSGGSQAPDGRCDAAGSPHPHHAPPRLWLGLFLPDLPLEALAHADAAAPPLAVVAGSRSRPEVLAASARAVRGGVEAGMLASAAHALLPELRLVRRDEASEDAALQGLAAWCGQLTTLVSLVPARGLLLEVGGSLRLLGGLEGVVSRVREGLAELGYRAHLGIAPTASGAWLLARAGIERPVTAMQALPDRLAPVPVECLDELPARAVVDLRRMGLRTFGDCCRMPRDGIARRVDPALPTLVDRALGRSAEVRTPFTPPPGFERRVAFAHEVRESGPLLLVARRLLEELSGYLCARAAGVRGLEVHLAHRLTPATRLDLELVAPSRDPEHLLRLLGARLERLELASGVSYVGLRARGIVPLAPAGGDLFHDRGTPDGGDWRMLVERLQARLGREGVTGLAIVADHRPERAWRYRGPDEPAPMVVDPRRTRGRRPPWLLERPLRLAEVDARPVHGGPLALLGGPERIESGWWDGDDVARDYYLAAGADGARYWIYRECREPRRWYLHGVFA